MEGFYNQDAYRAPYLAYSHACNSFYTFWQVLALKDLLNRSSVAARMNIRFDVDTVDYHLMSNSTH